MTATVVFEDGRYRDLLPLTYWRTIPELRIGYARLLDHTLAGLGGRTPTTATAVTVFCRTNMAAIAAERLQLPINAIPSSARALFINARLLLMEPVSLGEQDLGVQWEGDDPLLVCADRELLERLTPEVVLDAAAMRRVLSHVPHRRFIEAPRVLRYPWDMIQANETMLRLGWKRCISQGELVGRVCDGAHLLNKRAIHIGAGSVIKPGAVLDAEDGPIFIENNVTVLPNSSIAGPCYIGAGTLIQPGAIIREQTSIGPRCKIGGEVAECIIQGFSNKQHHGFLGHSYLGEWVNLGAGTTNSDLKNTYGTVRVPVNGVEVDTGQIFVGLTIGDHAKTGINQAFPTGAVVGFASQVATSRLAPKYVPSLAWVTERGIDRYDLEKCIGVAKRAMARRQKEMTHAEEQRFRDLPERISHLEAPIEPP